MDDVSTKLFFHQTNLIFSLPKQFNSRTVRTHFASQATCNKQEMTTEMQSPSRIRPRRAG